MRFHFEGDPQGLRVIDEIPEGQLLRLRGRNGIGKTSLIRLLQLATGGQPYESMPSAWATLRTGLGDCILLIDGLKEDRSILLKLTPSSWPRSPEPPGEWLGDAQLDGRPVTWAEVRQILKVFRVGGDQSLAKSMAATVRRDLGVLGVEREDLSHTILEWSGRLDELERYGREAARPAWTEVFARARAFEATARNEREIVRRVEDRLSKARQAEALLKQLSSLEQEGPRLRSAIQSTDRELDDLARRLKTQEDLLGQAVAKGAQAAEVEADLAYHQRLYRLRRERRKSRLSDVERCLAEGGLPSNAAHADVVQATQALTERISQLRRQRESVDRAAIVIEAIDDIHPGVSRAVSRGLGTETILDVDDRELRFEELEEGLVKQRQLRRGQTSEEGKKLEEMLEHFERQLSFLRAAPNAIRLLAKAEADVAETAERVRNLLAVDDSQSIKRFDELAAERDRLIDRMADASAQRGELKSELDRLTQSGGPGELRHRLSALGFEPTTEAVEISAMLEQLTGELTSAQMRADRARMDASDVRYQLQQLQRAIAAFRRFLDEPEGDWLGPLTAFLPAPESEPVDAQPAIQALHDAAASLQQDLTRVQNAYDALWQAMTVLANRIAQEAPALVARTQLLFENVVERYYEEHFGREFSDPAMRHALFADGEDVQVNLRELTTMWNTGKGDVVTRPLEAFSSGEHAFAYTRLQLERISTEQAENRAVFLDEFGAFMEHARLTDLTAFVRNQALGVWADKVVIVLPLNEVPVDRRLRELMDRGGYYVERDEV